MIRTFTYTLIKEMWTLYISTLSINFPVLIATSSNAQKLRLTMSLALPTLGVYCVFCSHRSQRTRNEGISCVCGSYDVLLYYCQSCDHMDPEWDRMQDHILRCHLCPLCRAYDPEDAALLLAHLFPWLFQDSAVPPCVARHT